MSYIINILCLLILFNIAMLGSYIDDLIFLPTYNTSINYNTPNTNLIISILKDSKREDLIEYADYINLNIIESIPNDTNNYIAYTLSLPQDVSFIAIYQKDLNGNLVFQYVIDDLSDLENFYFYKNFLVVEQNQSSKTNPLESKTFLQVFQISNNIPSIVFNKNILKEEIISQDNDSTIKTLESSSIDFLEGDILQIICITSNTVYENSSSDSSNGEFIEIEKNTTKEIFEWNSDSNNFVLINKKEL